MSAPVATQPGSVAPGQIVFHDAIQPPLPAGDYTLSATQEVRGLKGEDVPPYEAARPFRVDGPRFSLDPATVHMVFPPAGQAGAYFDVLPHVVFNDFALPWSRGIDPEGGMETATSPPWMALLTVYDDEAERAGEPSVVSPEEVIAPPPGTLPPCIPAGQVDPASDERVRVIDMELGFFRSIAPTLDELRYLAHARTVNTDGKVMLGMDDDGCFSLVVGNRVSKAVGGKNHVMLVSLEGHQAHLAGSGPPTQCDGTPPSAPYTRIRLVVLGSWTFSTPPGLPGSFVGLMQALEQPGRGGVGLLMLDSGGTAASPVATEALQTGYVPLQNSMRVGETATAWYRGPLVPAPTAREQVYGPFLFSDHATFYDPETGIFNQAYAAAWQIGRLLALSDGSYAAALFEWRRQYFAGLRKDADRRDVEARLAAAAPGLRAALPGGGVAARLGEILLRAGPALEERLPVVATRAERRAEADGGPLAPGEVDEILAAGGDPLLALRDKLRSVRP